MSADCCRCNHRTHPHQRTRLPEQHAIWTLSVALGGLLLAFAPASLGQAVETPEPTELTAEGLRHERGDGVAQDWETARERYEQAIAGGDIDAHWRLGRLLTFDHDDPFHAPDEGRELLRRAASAGDPRAAWDLAVIHFSGRDVPRDRAQAAQWAREAAAEIPQAAMMLAQLLESGQGLEKADPAGARQAAEEATAGDLADAWLMLGRMQLQGVGGEADPQQAVDNLQRAHELGHERATRMLAMALSDDRFLEPDFERARALLATRARIGEPHVQLAYARWLVTWNPQGPELARAWFWVQAARPYRGALDAGWDALWEELDEALRERLGADERERVQALAEEWRPGERVPDL